MTERATMPAAVADAVCSALGVSLPGDFDGVERLYRAWVDGVPFDPVAKAEALLAGRRPPGDDPVEVAERWLATGIGSTCWGHCTMLQAILDRAGVATTIGLDRMLLVPLVDFHSFLLATLDGTRYLIDPIHPSGQLLPFAPGAVGTHRAYEVGIDEDDGRLVHWFRPATHSPSGARYAVLGTTLDPADVRAFLAVSTAHSGVGRRFFQRRGDGDRILRFRPTDDGTALHETTMGPDGEQDTTLDDLDQAIARLGYRDAAVDRLVAAGLLNPTSPTPWTT